MSFKLPTTDQLREIGENLGMDLTPDYADAVIRYLTPFAAGYRELLALPDDLPPVKYPRGGYYRPQGEENRYGAWVAKFSIKGAAGGKLAGKKVAIKDTYAVAGVPLTNGASVLEGYIPEFDATVVTRLLDAGAEIVGKSTCEYFSFSGGAATSITGPVHNPRAMGHNAGGSSTGSGALVAAGEVDLATGGDQGGSIRIPASHCGVVGMKPTFGLVPYTGIMGMDPTIDHAGPLTARVADNALALEVMAGEDGYDPRQHGLKLDTYTRALGQGIDGLRDRGGEGRLWPIRLAPRRRRLRAPRRDRVAEARRHGARGLHSRGTRPGFRCGPRSPWKAPITCCSPAPASAAMSRASIRCRSQQGSPRCATAPTSSPTR